jgi:hypothetical protein
MGAPCLLDESCERKTRMELNDNAVACTDPINPQTGEVSASEIELYDELLAFAELSPEEQARLESPEPALEPREGSAEQARDCAFSETVLTGAPVESLTSASDSLDAIDADPAVGGGPSPSGPLSGFDLPQEVVYTGAMSRGVCLACGAESGADDLFCPTCGDFVDEVASTLPSNPTCGECKQPIDSEEIFCPSCGSAMPARR